MSDGDQPIATGNDDSPVRFASIGRRESLRAIQKPVASRPGIPRIKTKREMERERLFKDLDEELETDGTGDVGIWGNGVIEIGQGGGLAPRPSSAEAVLEVPGGVNLFEHTFAQSNQSQTRGTSLPVAPKPHSSPTQPMRPSPLHASPMNANSSLPTPDDSPGIPSPSLPGTPPLQGIMSPRRSPSPTAQAANLDSIRHFARGLMGPHTGGARSRTNTSTPSPPESPKTRRRDTKRVSLVAGRVVQPFTIPPNTSLPPLRVTTPEPPLGPKASLSSFSPFRSPGLQPTKVLALPPSLHRLDSTISIAPSTGAPSECSSPGSETAGGLGGRGIDDYVILQEAGKGAYGLVMRAKVKGPKGETVGVSLIVWLRIYLT
jgi:protein-serine/threonine kinase